MSHYYTDNKYLKSDRQSFEYHFADEVFHFTTDHGVFSKDHVDYGTYLLLKTVYRKALGEKILDLGCGWGVMGTILGRFHPESKISMVDVNSRACELAKLNAAVNGINASVYQTDDLTTLDQTYHSIVLNPPVRAGKSVIFALYEKAHAVLCATGHLYIVILKRQGAQSSLNKLKELFQYAEVIAKDGGYRIIEARK